MKTWEYPLVGLVLLAAALTVNVLRRRRRQKFDLSNFLRAKLIKAKLL